MMFRFWSSAYVRHLEAEITWLRTEMKRHEQRAADAVDQLLRVQTQHQAALPVRPLIADRESDATAEVEKLFADPDFAQAGT
jgi:hypothetical protein